METGLEFEHSSSIRTVQILSALFVNGLAGGFVWPYLPILLSRKGLPPDQIGVVLGLASLLILLFRIPLGRLLDHTAIPARVIRIILFIPFPIALLLTIYAREAAGLVLAIFLLHLARLPFLPLGLAILKRMAEKRKKPFSPLLFVSAHHLFLGVLGIVAGGIIMASGLHRTFLLVASLLAAGVLPLFLRTERPPERTVPPKKPPRMKPDRQEKLVLLSFFFLHLVNAPLLPFTELYMKRHPVHLAWVPWIAAIAELTMVVTALVLSRVRIRSESRWMMASASGILALRMVLYWSRPSSVGILGISLLDGLTSGIFWMVGLGWVARRMQGEKAFNQLAGYVDVVIITGGAFGTLLFGWAVLRWGFPGACGRLAPLNLLSPLLLFLAGREVWRSRRTPAPSR
ncbi:MAG: MFS transporter [Leptospirales bacterium]